MRKTTGLNTSLVVCSGIGLALAIYAYLIQLNVERDSRYTAFCDLGPHMSCTKTVKSRYSKGMGLVDETSIFNVPNSFLAIVYYSINATLAVSNSPFITKIAYWLCVLTNLVSFYMAFIMYFRVETICVVCVGMYIVNIVVINLLNIKGKQLAVVPKRARKNHGGKRKTE